MRDGPDARRCGCPVDEVNLRVVVAWISMYAGVGLEDLCRGDTAEVHENSAGFRLGVLSPIDR